jgi:hypothetical protein
VAVAKSSVATSSVLLAGAPHAEQNRPVAGTLVPQDEQVDMKLPDTVYRLERIQNETCFRKAGARRKLEATVYYYPDDELAPPPLVG